MTKKFKKVPKHVFKLDCGDDPEVRQWLHDNGFKWAGTKDFPEDFAPSSKFLIIENIGITTCDKGFFDRYDEVSLFNPYSKQITDEEKLAKAKKLEKKAKALRDEVAKKKVKQVLWVNEWSGTNNQHEVMWIEDGLIPTVVENIDLWHKVPTCIRFVKE